VPAAWVCEHFGGVAPAAVLDRFYLRLTPGGPRHAHLDGFDLHANVAVDGEDRERLEQLCRYLLRPAIAQDRLRLTQDGRIVLELKTAWESVT
jgi:hypothetical protein